MMKIIAHAVKVAVCINVLHCSDIDVVKLQKEMLEKFLYEGTMVFLRQAQRVECLEDMLAARKVEFERHGKKITTDK